MQIYYHIIDCERPCAPASPTDLLRFSKKEAFQLIISYQPFHLDSGRLTPILKFSQKHFIHICRSKFLQCRIHEQALRQTGFAKGEQKNDDLNDHILVISTYVVGSTVLSVGFIVAKNVILVT